MYAYLYFFIPAQAPLQPNFLFASHRRKVCQILLDSFLQNEILSLILLLESTSKLLQSYQMAQ